MPTWEDVVAAGTRFPGVEESTSYGTPSLKVRGKFMCRLRTNPDALVVRVIDVADQEALLKGDPDVFFVTPHYDGWPGVLVRLEAVDPVQLAELVEDAWRAQAPKRLSRRTTRADASPRGRRFGESAETLSHSGLPRGLAEARARARGQWLHAPGGDVVRHLLARAGAGRAQPAEGAGGARRRAARRPDRHVADAQDAAPGRRRGPRRGCTRCSRRGWRASERRLRQLGVTDPDARGEAIVGMVPATRAEIAEELGLTGPGGPAPDRARGDGGPDRDDDRQGLRPDQARQAARPRPVAGRARAPLLRGARRAPRATTWPTGPGCRSATAARPRTRRSTTARSRGASCRCTTSCCSDGATARRPCRRSSPSRSTRAAASSAPSWSTTASWRS